MQNEASGLKRSVWKEEGKGGDPGAIAAALASLLLGYLDVALMQSPEADAGSTAQSMQVQVPLIMMLHATEGTVHQKFRVVLCWVISVIHMCRRLL